MGQGEEKACFTRSAPEQKRNVNTKCKGSVIYNGEGSMRIGSIFIEVPGEEESY